MAEWLKIMLICIGVTLFIICIGRAIKIEQVVWYYEYRYIPSFYSVLFASHINRTRHMRCPRCNKKLWHKKVLTK